MAIVTTENKQDAYKFFIVSFGAVTGVEYMQQIYDAYADGLNTQQIVNIFSTKKEFKSIYPDFLDNTQFASNLIENVVGASATDASKAQAKVDVLAALNAGWSKGDVIYQIFQNLSNKSEDDAEWAGTAKLLKNKVAVAQYLTEVKLLSATDIAKLQAPLNSVTADSDVSTPAAIDKLLNGSASSQTDLGLGNDNIVASQEGLTFTASIKQNALGGVANTLESGDTIIAKGTGNKLVADVAASGLVDGTNNAPAISPTTKNVQVVEFRAQNVGQVGGVHTTNAQANIDAQKMEGVQQWWSVNSRTDLKIEDVRTRPEDTTIGMRNTDPEVSFKVYFDPEQLQAGATVSNSALTLTLDKIATPGDLSNNVFNGVKFTLGGKAITLQSDAIGAATTHAELLAALEAAAADNADLAGVTFKLNANNTITLTDPAGKEFGTGSWLTPNGDIPAVGDFKWAQAIGEPQRGEELISTNVVLDNVGRTSAGGDLDIGSLGDGGVEQFNVVVDRNSWLKSMSSTDHAGEPQAHGDDEDGQDEYLQEVYLTSTGANGNLKVGTTVATRLDGRLAEGLSDVRVVDGSAFKGSLNLGIVLTEDALGRYLDKATDEVEFNYTGSQANDTFNINVDGDVSEDPDFAMNVNLGAGDDRLILGGATRLNSTSVDGGTGTNTFVTSTSVGVDADTTFRSFTNFQNYEVEGAGSDHDFTDLASVQNVTVATDANADVLLRDLPAGISTVSVSGKNQTIGNANNADQTFGTLTVEAADAAALTVALNNTARVNGALSIDELLIDDENTTNLSAVRTLNVVSNGARQTSNEITAINAEKVDTFNFSGTQALEVGINAAANSTKADALKSNLKADASALTGQFTLNINSDIVTDLNAASKNVSFVGAAGAKDELVFVGAVDSKAQTSVSGFETVTFEDGGQFDAVNASGVTLYKSLSGDALTLTNLQGVENVELGTVTGGNTGGAQAFQTAAVSSTSALNLKINDAAAAQEINTKGFTTLNLNLSANANNKVFDLDLSKVVVDTNGAPAVVTNTGGGAIPVAGVYASAAEVEATHFTKANLTNVVVTGGSSTFAAVNDTLDLTLSATVKLVDVSGYKGQVTATIADALVATIAGVDYTTGNTVVKVGAFGINFTDVDATTSADTVTTFQFTADAGNADQNWVIDGFRGINDGTSTLSDLTILDLSALGITGLADLNVSDTGADIVIKSNGTHNFEIVLTGVADAADLGIENFKFAA